MLGVELVTDRKEKTPAKAETTELFEKLKGAVSHSAPLHGYDYLLISTCLDIFVFFCFIICVNRSRSTSWKGRSAW